MRDLARSAEAVSAEIEFSVDGFPPAKNEALSMLGRGHSHSPRVVALLTAAQRAIESGQKPLGTQAIGMEVTLRAPTDIDPGDATNYLGGIADVLEDKQHRDIAHRGILDHLGDLRTVALYRNDRQIKEIQYRQVPSNRPSYSVRIWVLGREE